VVAKQKQAGYEDVLAAPAHMVAEVLNGEVVLSPRPAYRHANATSAILAGVFPYARRSGDDGPSGWWILVEPELHFGRQIMVPDLAGWRRERLPEIPDVAYLDIAPDWVCEVASPSTRRIDRMVKSGLYLEHGVAWMWLVTPTEELVEVFRAHEGQWLLAATAVGPEPARLPPFDAIELDIGRWWELR